MIYIIVPTYGGIEDTKKFINSIKESINEEYLLILIDDHPEKITFNSIQQNTSIKVISSDKELWWVGSINLGIYTLINTYNLNDKDIVVFANNDIQINKKSFDTLKYELQKDKNQIIHPRTFNHQGVEVSSGAKIVTFFPYITKHPKKFKKEKAVVDMGTGRFLMMNGFVLKKVGFINKDLIQYGGDNDFTLSAKRFHSINTYVLRDAICSLNDIQTGIKNHNIKTIKELYESFYSIRSPNSVKYRFILFRKFFGMIGAFFITISVTINTIVKFIFK